MPYFPIIEPTSDMFQISDFPIEQSHHLYTSSSPIYIYMPSPKQLRIAAVLAQVFRKHTKNIDVGTIQLLSLDVKALMQFPSCMKDLLECDTFKAWNMTLKSFNTFRGIDIDVKDCAVFFY